MSSRPSKSSAPAGAASTAPPIDPESGLYSPPLGACAHFSACADHVVVFMLGPEQKNRADVRPPCEKIYLHRAVDGSREDDPHNNFLSSSVDIEQSWCRSCCKRRSPSTDSNRLISTDRFTSSCTRSLATHRGSFQLSCRCSCVVL